MKSKINTAVESVTLTLSPREAMVIKTLIMHCTGVKAFSTKLRVNTTDESEPIEVLEALLDSLAGVCDSSYFYDPLTERCAPAFDLDKYCRLGSDKPKDK